MFTMFSNFKKKYIDPYILSHSPAQEEADLLVRTDEDQTVADSASVERSWANALVETICVAGCACVFCRRRSRPDQDVETGRARLNIAPAKPRRNHRRNMPPTSSIMQVLYPPSYLNTPLPDPDPPAYFPGPFPVANDIQEQGPPIFSRNAPVARSSPSSFPAGAPSSGIPVVGPPLPIDRRGRAPPYVPRLPDQHRVESVGMRGEIPEDSEELPAYSRFDTTRPRFPLASDILGPYPHISVLSPTAH